MPSVRRRGGLSPEQVDGLDGRPRKMDRASVMMAMTAMADAKAHAAEVASRLNITTTTLYAYVNGDGVLKPAGQALLRS